jgi:hypothetical protein
LAGKAAAVLLEALKARREKASMPPGAAAEAIAYALTG